jgi:hypothetical protein
VGWSACPPEKAEFAMRTVGGGLGRISDPATANRTSHLFFRTDRPIDREALHAELVAHPWPNFNMAQQSIGQRDFVPVLNRIIKEAQ